MPLGNQEMKRDSGKRQWRLLPWIGTQEVIKVLEFGAEKYSVAGWRNVDNWDKRYLDAAFRHLVAYAGGEVTDTESNLPHLAHAVCCLLFMLELRSEISSEVAL